MVPPLTGPGKKFNSKDIRPDVIKRNWTIDKCSPLKAGIALHVVIELLFPTPTTSLLYRSCRQRSDVPLANRAGVESGFDVFAILFYPRTATRVVVNG
jgi:hypothetical protein